MRKFKKQRDLILALDADIDRQLAEVATSAGAMSTRATLLVGAAGISASVQEPAAGYLAVALNGAAALLGIALLLMRTARELPIAEAETTFWDNDPVAARRNLMHWKLGVLREREASLKRRRPVLIAGFALFAVGIVVEPLMPLICSARG